MGWIEEDAKKTVFKYRLPDGEIIYGSVAEFEKEGITIKGLPGDEIEIEGVKATYAGFLPRQAPHVGKLGREGSNADILAFKQKCREHFVKNEMDDVRHKHGKNFDDSLVAAAARRIREGKKDKLDV